MPSLTQNFDMHYLDTFQIEFNVSTLPDADGGPPGFTYGLHSFDQVAFLVGTSVNSGAVLEKSTTYWDRGLYGGTLYSEANISTFEAGLPNEQLSGFDYFFVIPTTGESQTSGDGTGLQLRVRILWNSTDSENTVASFTPAVFGNQGGIGFESGDTITIDADNFETAGGTAATSDLVITLTGNTQPNPGNLPDNWGGVTIDAPSGFNSTARILVDMEQETIGPNLDGTAKTYYYELVVGVLNDYSRPLSFPVYETQVIAQGEITVHQSLFTEAGYRP